MRFARSGELQRAAMLAHMIGEPVTLRSVAPHEAAGAAAKDAVAKQRAGCAVEEVPVIAGHMVNRPHKQRFEC